VAKHWVLLGVFVSAAAEAQEGNECLRGGRVASKGWEQPYNPHMMGT